MDAAQLPAFLTSGTVEDLLATASLLDPGALAAAGPTWAAYRVVSRTV